MTAEDRAIAVGILSKSLDRERYGRVAEFLESRGQFAVDAEACAQIKALASSARVTCEYLCLMERVFNMAHGKGIPVTFSDTNNNNEDNTIKR